MADANGMDPFAHRMDRNPKEDRYGWREKKGKRKYADTEKDIAGLRAMLGLHKEDGAMREDERSSLLSGGRFSGSPLAELLGGSTYERTKQVEKNDGSFEHTDGGATTSDLDARLTTRQKLLDRAGKEGHDVSGYSNRNREFQDLTSEGGQFAEKAHLFMSPFNEELSHDPVVNKGDPEDSTATSVPPSSMADPMAEPISPPGAPNPEWDLALQRKDSFMTDATAASTKAEWNDKLANPLDQEKRRNLIGNTSNLLQAFNGPMSSGPAASSTGKWAQGALQSGKAEGFANIERRYDRERERVEDIESGYDFDETQTNREYARNQATLSRDGKNIDPRFMPAIQSAGTGLVQEAVSQHADDPRATAQMVAGTQAGSSSTAADNMVKQSKAFLNQAKASESQLLTALKGASHPKQQEMIQAKIDEIRQNIATAEVKTGILRDFDSE